MRSRVGVWVLVQALVLSALGGLCGCVTTAYQSLDRTDGQDITQLTETEFQVRYSAGALTSQTALDDFVRLRCAELTVQRGYDYFEMGERFDSLMFTRSTSVMVRVYKGAIPEGATLFHDAHAVLAELSQVPRD